MSGEVSQQDEIAELRARLDTFEASLFGPGSGIDCGLVGRVRSDGHRIDGLERAVKALELARASDAELAEGLEYHRRTTIGRPSTEAYLDEAARRLRGRAPQASTEAKP